VIVVEKERAAVGRWSEDARIGIEDLQILLVEAHVARDVGTKRADGVCERGGAIAGMKFFGDGAPPTISRRSRTMGLNPPLAR